MALESRSPQYISSHFADVILSDIRPIQLKQDALDALNVLIDEVLWSILSSGGSLQTERLRAGLLHILPTSLGKEALLEAEVELRAYWDRTTPNGKIPTPEDDSKTFNLTWSYELLRLKCEAYSTLNESDDDPDAEKRLQKKMAGDGAITSPRQSLVAPAALYLTAILESICEHILSNVARVAARDSSRTGATGQDIFVALCEDDAIYGLFKTMKVYNQIEQLSLSPEPRRSKSISRTEKHSISTSPSVEQISIREPPGMAPSHRSRTSADVSTAASAASRSSFEKARVVKKLISSRASQDREEASHRRSGSLAYDDGWEDGSEGSALQEFDSLMKSSQTMKVSLTPDRLRSMEARKQKEHSSSSQPPRSLNHSSPLKVHAISEGDEEPVAFPNRRTASNPSFSASSTTASSRAPSTSTTARLPLPRKPSDSEIKMPSVSSRGPPKGFDADPFPQKTRKIQKKRESIDLDDIMNGSDDEANIAPGSSPVSSPRRTVVSSRTRELVDFLDRGPPTDGHQVPNLSKSGRDLVEFLNQGPPQTFSSPPSTMSPDPKKGSGRLQRMMSKLSMNSDRAKADDIPKPLRTPTSAHPQLHTTSSAGNLTSLANRPIPPRFPRPISPPSSPSDDQHAHMRPRAQSTASQPSTPRNGVESPVLLPKPSQENGLGRMPAPTPNGHYRTAHGEPPRNETPPTQVASPPSSPRQNGPAEPIKRIAPAAYRGPDILPTPKPALPAGNFSEDDARDVRRRFTQATNADECRVLLEIFLAKSGRPIERNSDNPYPSPSPSDRGSQTPQEVLIEPAVESSLVGLFLEGENLGELVFPSAAIQKRRTKRKSQKLEPNGTAAPTGGAPPPPSPIPPRAVPPSMPSPHQERPNGRSPVVSRYTELTRKPVPYAGA